MAVLSTCSVLQLMPSLQRGGSSASLHNSQMRSTIFQLMIHTLDPLAEGEQMPLSYTIPCPTPIAGTNHCDLYKAIQVRVGVKQHGSVKVSHISLHHLRTWPIMVDMLIAVKKFLVKVHSFLF